jgi:predicted kinase
MRMLILTVGLPRAGKTTWAKSTGLPIVSPDAIRYAIHGERFNRVAEPWVWQFAYTMASALLIADGSRPVIVDATNVTDGRRAEWAKRFPNCVARIISTSATECIKRARDEEDEHIVPIIERMASEWDVPFAFAPEWATVGQDGVLTACATDRLHDGFYVNFI